MAQFDIPWLQKAWDSNQNLYPEIEEEKHWLQALGDNLRSFSSGMVGQDTLDESFGAGAAKLDSYIENTRAQRKALKAQREAQMNNSFLALARLLKPDTTAGRGTGSRNFKREQLQFVNDVKHRMINRLPVRPDEFDLARQYTYDMDEPQYRVTNVDQYGNETVEPIPGSGMNMGKNFWPNSMSEEDIGAWLRLPENASLINPNFRPGAFNELGVQTELPGNRQMIPSETVTPETVVPETPAETETPDTTLASEPEPYTGPFPKTRPPVDPSIAINKAGMPAAPVPDSVDAIIEANQATPDLPQAGSFSFGGPGQFYWGPEAETVDTPLPKMRPTRDVEPQADPNMMRKYFSGEEPRATTNKSIDELIAEAQNEFGGVLPNTDMTIPGLESGAYVPPPTMDEMGMLAPPSEVGITRTIPKLQDFPATDSEVRPGNPGAPSVEQIIEENQVAPQSETPEVDAEIEKRLTRRRKQEADPAGTKYFLHPDSEGGGWTSTYPDGTTERFDPQGNKIEPGGQQKLSAKTGTTGDVYQISGQDMQAADIANVSPATQLNQLSDAQVARLGLENPDLLLQMARAQRQRDANLPPEKGELVPTTDNLRSTRKFSGQEMKDLANMRSAMRNMNKAMDMMIGSDGKVKDTRLFNSLRVPFQAGKIFDADAEKYFGLIGGVYPLVLNLRTGAAFNDNELQAVNNLTGPGIIAYQDNYPDKMYVVMDELMSRAFSLYDMNLQDAVEWSRADDRANWQNSRGQSLPRSLEYELNRVPQYYWDYLGGGAAPGSATPDTDVNTRIDELLGR